jgi:hypothetical protein
LPGDWEDASPVIGSIVSENFEDAFSRTDRGESDEGDSEGDMAADPNMPDDPKIPELWVNYEEGEKMEPCIVSGEDAGVLSTVSTSTLRSEPVDFVTSMHEFRVPKSESLVILYSTRMQMWKYLG